MRKNNFINYVSKMPLLLIALYLSSCGSGTPSSIPSNNASVNIPMHLTDESQTLVGYINVVDTVSGLKLTAQLNGLESSLKAGAHGFHIHENPSCADMGMAAGGHLDPYQTKHHLGPYNNGHLGDLPTIDIKEDYTSNSTVIAPRLHLKDILGHSIMVHNGGDNYSDEPPLGGGGPRMICGVIPNKANT